MSVQDYQDFVMDLEKRLQVIQQEFITQNNPSAQLVGPLLAIAMLVKSDLLPFARDRYLAMVDSPQWKIADDYLLSLKAEVEYMLAGPGAFKNSHMG